MIQVYYHSELSKNANASNPDSVSSLWYLVDDNGSYTIPATALSAFPVSSFISYKIARANAYLVNMTSSSKKVDLYTAVEATSTPIQVILRPTVFVRLERTNDVSYSDPYYSIESTYYKVRYYWGPNAGIPAILVEGINMNLSYSSRDWDVYGGYDEYNDNYFVSGSPGTQEYDGPGYTELFYYSNGYYHQSDYYLNTGDNYTIIN